MHVNNMKFTDLNGRGEGVLKIGRGFEGDSSSNDLFKAIGRGIMADYSLNNHGRIGCGCVSQQFFRVVVAASDWRRNDQI